MGDQWKKDAAELLELIGGDKPYQMRILSSNLSCVRASLKGTRFEAVGDRELRTIIPIAITAIHDGRSDVGS